MIDQRRFAGHRDGFRREPTFSSALTVAANDPLSSMPSRRNGVEAGERKGHGVDAAAQLLDLVLAGRVGHDGADLFDQGGTGRFDRDSRKNRAGRILHDPGYGSRGLARRAQGGRRTPTRAR